VFAYILCMFNVYRVPIRFTLKEGCLAFSPGFTVWLY